jgi:tetratricopeptide (TPR) repeat protein
MTMTEKRETIAIPTEELAGVRAAYDEGKYLRAYELAAKFGPAQAWTGTAPRILAGRLVPHLGAYRLGLALHLTTWRSDPGDIEACYFRALALLTVRGPMRAWAFLQKIGPMREAPQPLLSYWLALHAIVLGRSRDFDAAETWLACAERDAPERAVPWLRVERAELYEAEDCYEQALSASREALQCRPWYRPAVQNCAHLLQLLDRDQEALDLLVEASERIESCAVVGQLAVLQSEMGHHGDARRSFNRFAEVAILIDKKTEQWLSGRRSDEAYYCGDLAAAGRFARESREPFFLALADRLESSATEDRRVLLGVGFVRQHHQTCVPATLTAVAHFWGKEADQVEVAEEICYDGTPDHRERSWADQNGFIAREFTVTWDAAVALLDRGVPFTLTTVETQSAHLQAVIGYDARRGTLLIRDPTMPYSGEMAAEGMLRRYRSVGPRGMLLVPRDRAALLEGLALPDAALYDGLHAMQVALRDHKRESASAEYAALSSGNSGHRIALQASYVLAQYDADYAGMLAALEGLLALFPEDVNLRLSQLGCLRTLGRRDDRLAIYRDVCGRPGADAVLSRQYAQELQPDAREHDLVARLIRRALRLRPLDAPSMSMLGDLAWEEHRLADAVELYRLVACLQDKDEGFARGFFISARHLHRQDEALRFLKGRFRRFGSRSAQPARTLYWAYSQLERMSEAFGILDEALVLRPADGDLLLFAAESHGTLGAFERAEERLDAARGMCRLGNWLRTAAYLASLRGDLVGSLALWNQVVEAEPAALDANRAVTRLLAETEGRAAALCHIETTCERFPHNYSLHQSWIEWLREEMPETLERAVRALLLIHPADAWAHRELALVLSSQSRHEEAALEMKLATELEPSSPAEASVRGQLLERAGAGTAAREAYREAIRRAVDTDFAIARLIETCDSRAERVESLRFIETELVRQVTFGDGLLEFAQRARGTLGADELLATLRQAHAARPDLWHAHSALIKDLSGRGDHAEALELAQQATARFPLLPRIWLDLAGVCKAIGDRAGQIDALGRALAITPTWSDPARQMAEALEADGKLEESRAVLERALRYAPLDPFNHGYLADVLWRLGEQDGALARLTHALRLAPGYDWAWHTLVSWTRTLGQTDRPVELARELTQLHGGKADTWLALARLLQGSEHLEERLAAVERAIALAPREFEPYDLKAELLADAGRFDEAEAACHASVWGDQPPVPLRGRAAWVDAQRGNLTSAIARMRSVVDTDPDYYWGWRNLADWCGSAEKIPLYLEAADAMVRLAPTSPVALGYRGDARRKNGDSAGAKEDFRSALAAAPDYQFAAMNLFDLELADRKLEAAGSVLALLKEHSSGPFVGAREVQLAAASRDRPTATNAFKRLCVTPGEGSEWPLQAADSAFEKRWARQVLPILEEALRSPEVNPQVAELWVTRCVARRRWRRLGKLDKLLGRGEIGRRAICSYLTAMGRAKRKRRILACVRRHRAFLREDTECWATAGYALVAVARNRDAAAWLGDWTGREGLQPWMLFNLSLALRDLRQNEDATLVNRQALALPADGTTPRHCVWVALEEALSGQSQEAAARLDGLDGAGLKSLERYVFQLTKILVDFQGGRADAQSPGAALAEASARSALHRDDYRLALEVYRRVVRRISSQYRPVHGSLWTLWRWLNPPRAAR